MKRMNSASHIAARWLRAGLGCAWIALTGFPVAGQSPSPRNSPTKSPSTPAASTREDPLAPLLQQANEAIDKMDFAEALDPLQKYLAQRPDEAYPHFQLGYAYAGLKRADDAKREFSRAIELDAKMAPAYQNLGLVEMDDDPAAAAESFRRAAELQPTESRPRFLTGYALEQAGKFSGATEAYRSALALSPKGYEAHFALGRVLLRTNDAAGAEEQFRAAIGLNSGSAPARLGLGSALMAQKKYDAATEALADYLNLNPQDRSARTDRAFALVQLVRYDDALAELDRASTGAVPSPDALKLRGEIFMQQKKWIDAESALKQANAASPQDGEIQEWMGHVEIELHNYPEAVRTLEQAYSRNPRSVEALRDLANAFYLAENYAGALEAMDRLAKLETPQPGSWFIRAICYDKLSRKAEAIEAYQKFLDQDGGQHDTQDFQARQRILVLRKELGESKKK
jgi:superkiller protein 3